MFYSLIYFSLCLGSRMLRKNSITEVSEKEENMVRILSICLLTGNYRINQRSLEMSSLIIDYDMKRDNSVKKGTTNDDSELILLRRNFRAAALHIIVILKYH
jgi:hypothetical protein